jgi:hypothetical protein
VGDICSSFAAAAYLQFIDFPKDKKVISRIKIEIYNIAAFTKKNEHPLELLFCQIKPPI